MKTIVFAAAASKEFDGLPIKPQERIMDALTEYAVNGVGDIKRLSARPGFRLRVGSGTRTSDTYKRN